MNRIISASVLWLTLSLAAAIDGPVMNTSPLGLELDACCLRTGCAAACDNLVDYPSEEIVDIGPIGRRNLLPVFLPVLPECCLERSGGASADPHFKLWNGEYYDYHGQCSLVLVHAPDFAQGLGLDIHIRTKIRYNYSFIESAAIKIGEDTLEVSSFGAYFLNGVGGVDLGQHGMLGPFSVHHEQLNTKSHLFTIALDLEGHGAQKLLLKTFKDWVSISFEGITPGSTLAEELGSSVGLMGQFPTGAKLARDGITSFLENDMNAFGQEWQVRDSDSMLFQSLQGPQYPEQCQLPNFDTKTQRRRLGETVITQAQAEAACENQDRNQAQQKMCVYDVLAANDLDMAQAGVF